MAEIDLVPTDYRNRVMIYGWGRRLFVSFTMFTLFSVVIYVVLEVGNRRLVENVALENIRQQSVMQGRDALREISEKRDLYQHQWELLRYLRNGTAAARMFVIIDRAIPSGEIWFLNWDYKNSGAIAKIQPESAGNSYLIPLTNSRGQDAGEVWEINTRMTIKGQASDHSAVSRFVRRLYEQPEVNDVRILNISRQISAGVVNFDMVVTVSSELVAG